MSGLGFPCNVHYCISLHRDKFKVHKLDPTVSGLCPACLIPLTHGFIVGRRALTRRNPDRSPRTYELRSIPLNPVQSTGSDMPDLIWSRYLQYTIWTTSRDFPGDGRGIKTKGGSLQHFFDAPSSREYQSLVDFRYRREIKDC